MVRSYKSEALVVFKDQFEVVLELLFGLVLGEEEYIETSVGCW